MFFNETFHLFLIILVLFAAAVQSFALDLQYNDNVFDLKNRFKSLEHIVKKQDKIIRKNKKALDTNENRSEQYIFGKQMPTSYKGGDLIANSEEQCDKYSYQNLAVDYEDQNYDYKMLNLIPSKLTTDINRRGVSSNGALVRNLPNSSLYPSVLTKAVEISLNPSSHIIPGESLLSNVAQKMNTSTLALAEKIAKSETSGNNDQLSKVFQSYIKSNAALSPPSSLELKRTSIQPNLKQVVKSNEPYIENEYFHGTSAESLAGILGRVLNKLENMQNAKNNDDVEHPDGAPCDVIGTWSSSKLGFCFDIQLLTDNIRYISPAEINNKILSIRISECIPTKHHHIIDLDWKFTGSAIKQWGGPFYVYGQKRTESVAATFLGFCRTCGGIDTIFGSWNFISPSKDCHDISLANEVRQDILTRVRLEIKRKERLKDLLYENRHGKV